MANKVNKTNRDLLALVQTLNVLLVDENFVKENSKGVKKLQKIAGKIKDPLDKYNEQLEDIRLDCAHVDKEGALLLDEKGGYKFSKDGIKDLNKKIKELLDKEFEFYQFTFSHEGIEKYGFLEGWVENLTFPKEEATEEEV
mgnify:CR=1 FL=1